MDFLTVKDAAVIYGHDERHIRRLIAAGEIQAEQRQNPNNGRKQYMIPVSSLPEELQKRYYRQLERSLPPVPPPEEAEERPAKTLADYSAAEREQIAEWTAILQEWQAFRRRYYKGMTKADPTFVAGLAATRPELQLSVDILYRRWSAYQAGDLAGLIGRRGGYNRGETTIPGPVWEGFCFYYLDQRRLSVSRCYEIIKDWTAEYYPEWVPLLPGERTFRRRVETIPLAVRTYMRYGDKALTDECLPYIERLYDDLEANDVWIADNHTLDIASMERGTETVHRLHLTAFMDAKSGELMGWNLTENPCSDSTIFALRHGIERRGIPRMVYFDNGTEFLTYDIAGRGHRRRKSTSMIDRPPPILSQLGIEMKNALVRNARAKPIERMFLTFKNSISRLFDTFTGGNIMEKPESLKRKLKNGQIPMDHELREIIDILIEGQYNLEDYGGPERCYKGMSRAEVWAESIERRGIRRASKEDLDLMLMRSSQYQKISRKGVHITIAGEKLWYAAEDTWLHLGEEVYTRHDPRDLSSIKVYDRDDRYLFDLPADRELMLDFLEDGTDGIQTAQAKMRRSKRMVKDLARGLTASLTPAQKIDALDIRCRKAEAARLGTIIPQPKTIIPIRAAQEQAQVKAAVGGDTQIIPIDMAKMNRNAARRTGKTD